MRTRTRNLKRLLSLVLCLCLVTGLLPATVLAADAPAITTESLAEATVGEEYTAQLAATASDRNGALTWEATDLPDWLTLTDNGGGTATLDGKPTETGDFSVTVKVTETIPAESEEPGQGTDPAEEAEPAGPTVLTDTRTYALTVAEAVQAEPEPEPGITNGITPLAVTKKVQLDFNLYLQPESGGMVGQEDTITQFSIANELFLTVDNYPGTHPTKIALISSTLDVANLNETNLNNNALVLSVGGQNGAMEAVPGQLVVNNFRTVDANGSAPSNDGITLTDGFKYRFLVWDGAESGDQTVYYSSETYTYTEDNAIPMTVTKDGQSVTSFANTDTITITATLPTPPTRVTSVVFVDSQHATSTTYMYLEAGNVTLSDNTVSITMNGLYSKDFGGNQDERLVPGTYNIILYDDSSTGEIKYVSTASYTVTGEGGTGNSTCTAAFATDESFTNTVYTVQNNGTAYYVRLSNFSPALSLPDLTNQPSPNYSVSISAGTYTLWVTDTKVEYNTDGSTVAYIRKGPAAIADYNSSTTLPTGSYALEINIYNPNTSMTTPLYTYTSINQMTVTEATVSTPTITTDSPLPGGVTGTAYSQTLQATPGTDGKAVTWSVTSGSLPSGLTLSEGGTISGTPTAAGTYTFTVTAAEQDGGTTSKSFIIAVTQAITSAGLTVTGGNYSPGDSISVYWNMSASLTSDAAATLTLHYNNGQIAECPMTRYSNYFYAYVALPEGCASVEKLSAKANISGQTVTGENIQPGITMKGKLSLTWTSPSTSGTLTVKGSSNETVATRSLSKNSTGLELSLPAGTYTLSATAYVSGLGNQTLLESTTVAVTEGATTAKSLSFNTLQAVTYRPAVKLEGGGSTSNYTLCWYSDAAGETLLATGRSYTALSTATLYVRAVPTYSVSATHNESTLTQVTAANNNPTLTLPAKTADTVTVNVQCEDVAGGADIKTVSGYVVLSQPGADGYKKTTQERVYNAGAVTFEGVTAGSTITFTPDQKYACGPVSETISSVTGGSQTITLKAEALKGIISSNITLQYPDRTTNLTFTTMSNLKVKKVGGTVIPHHRTSGNILVLDDLTELSDGTQLTISGQYGSGDFPIAVFEEDVTLSNDGKLTATADIDMVARGTARISVQNQSRVAADLLLYQDDKLFYTKDSFIASYVSTSDYAYKSGWSPRLPAGSYTVYVVNRDYLRTVNPTTYQTKSDIRFEKGTYSCADFTIQNNKTTSVTLNVPDVVQAYADVNFEMSSVTMSVDFPGTFTHTTVITLTGDEQLDETRGITLYLYNDQSRTASALQSLTINGIPYMNVLQSSIDGCVTLSFTGDELQKLYGGFPLRVSYVMARYDYSRLEGRSYMTYTNDSGESRSVKVGAFYQETDDVTLNVPSMVNEKTFTVSGYVPQRGKDVTVYLDGAAVATVRSGWRADVSGKVISTTNGYFAAQVTLPEDVEEFDAFRVSAFCEGAMSEEAEVMYTTTSGLLTEVRFYPGRSGNLKDEYTVWKLGDSPSEGQRYRASNGSNWLRWEMYFANAEKVKNVVVHVPRSDGSEEEVPANRITTSGREGTFQTIPVLIYGASPTGVYVTYETELVPRANSKTSVSAEDFAAGIAALNNSGIISQMMGTQDSLTFTLKNPEGEDIPVTVESTTEDWGEDENEILAELASFDALKQKPEYSTLPSYILYYDEGYLDIYEDDVEGGFWGSDRICKYSTADDGTIYQREIYTMGERIIITWDVGAKTTTTHRITLGSGTGSGQPDEKKVTSESEYVQDYQRTAQVEQLWMLFYQQLSDACEKAGTASTLSARTMSLAAPKGGKLSLKVKIDVNKLKEQADALAEDSETWAEGQEITAAEIRQIKDFLDDNPGLVDLYKMHQSTGGDNPYQVVGDIRATYYERGMGLIEKALSLATGKPKDVVDTLKDGIKDYAIDTVKGKIFYRQSEGMVCDLYVAARQAERTETGVGGLLQGGINWSRFPTNIYDPNSNFSAGHNRQTLPNSPSYTYDPSGYVYEAVPSNRVKGATVNLYTFNESAKVEEWVDHKLYNIETNPQITEEDGRYEWFVPEGYWRVVVTKDGYEPVDTGSSPNYGKKAKPVEGDPVSRRYWMPVLPIQLDVNIPLVSYAAPTVQKVEATAEGVYVTFSKYMETSLSPSDFQINGKTPADVTPVNAEASSSEKGAEKYASIFLLTYPANMEVSADDTIKVYVGNTVTSYAGTEMGKTYTDDAVKVQEQLDPTTAPTLDTGSPTSGGTVDKNTVVYLTVPTGAAVYYTTDGSDPADETNQNRKQYNASNGIIVDRTMTILAVAVKAGMSNSDLLMLDYSVEGDLPEGPTDPEIPVNPVSPGGSGDDDSYSISVPASSSIKGGSITVSPRSAEKGDTVTITVKPDEGYELDKLTVTDGKGSEVELTGKSGGRYTFTMPGSSVKVQVSFKEIAEPASNPFTDVYESDYYYDAVLWAVANGVTAGTSATTFSPNATVTRAQMVTFLWRAYGSPKATGSNPFADVSADAYYYDAVLWAVANGVTNGTSATTFSPDTPVTRSQAVTFQWRAAGSPVVTGDSFDDVAADAYYAGAVAWAVANGITNGTGGNKFSPEVTVTRAQAVTFLWRELA